MMAESQALEEVTQAAFNGVLRALEARNLSIEKVPGPIIVGIIYWSGLKQPEPKQGEMFGQGSAE
jgi:hypothetical protein